REDEPAHAPAERDVDAVAVEPAFALADRGAEPLLQHEGPDDEAGEQHPGRPAVAVDPLTRTEDHQQQAERGLHRKPRRRGDEVVRRAAVGCRCRHVFSYGPIYLGSCLRYWKIRIRFTSRRRSPTPS